MARKAERLAGQRRWILAGLGALVVWCVVGAGAASAATIPGRYIVVLKDSVADPGAVAAAHARRYGVQDEHVYRNVFPGYAAVIPGGRLAALRADRDVAFVAADSSLTAAAAQPADCGDPSIVQCVTRASRRIGAPDSSARSGDGRGSVPLNVAVVDTGIELTHPDLNVVGGVDCTGAKGYADLNGHGTLTAGVIGALDNGFGTVGVAPGARLWSVRALNSQNTGSKSTLLCALDWISGTRGDANPGNDIAVANMSLAGPGEDTGNCGQTPGSDKDPLHLAICRATQAGVTIVVAAGNSASDAAGFAPAAYDEVITVGGMRDTDGLPGGLGQALLCNSADPSDDVFAAFSNYGADVDVAAPAFCVGGTYIEGSYTSWSGTSFAAPIVAGTVALCLASGRKPCAGLTPAQIAAKIRAEAAAYNQANPGYGYQGDPLRPVAGKHYGYLIRAALY
jgi:subtilisin